MLRRALAATALTAVALGIGAAPANAKTGPRRLVILWLDGTTIDDWARPELPNFATFLRRASVALLSTRTAGDASTARAMRAEAALEFGAGARDTPSAGLLGRALFRAGVISFVVGDAAGTDGDDAATDLALGTSQAGRRHPGRPDRNFPTGIRADIARLAAAAPFLERSRVLLVDPGDTARVQRSLGSDPPAAEPWTRLSMRRTDVLLDGLVKLRPNDAVMVIAPTPPEWTRARGIRLGAIALAGPGIPPGLASSATTRRQGVLALHDVAPTILRMFGIGVPDGMEGRPARFDRARDAVARVRALERDIVHAAEARRPVTRSALLAASVLALLALFTVVTGRGRGFWRDALATAIVACAALPLGMYVEGALPSRTRAQAVIAVFAFALALALVARVALGHQRALAYVLVATVAVVLADLFGGQSLGARAPISFQIAGGGRFYGIGDEMLGAIVGAAILAGALMLDRAEPRAWNAVATGIALFGIAFVLGSPWQGAKFGAALTAIPAFGILAVRAAGLRFGARAVLGIAAAAFLLTGMLVVADAVRPGSEQTHVARAATGRTKIAPLFQRKIGSTLRITARTAWLPATLAMAGSVALIAWRRRALLDRAMWGRPHLRAGLAGAVIGMAAGLVFQDGGITAAALIALEGSAAAWIVLLAPDG